MHTLTVNPVVSHQVPPILRAGKQETAYSIVTVKPYPTDFPEARVSLTTNINENSSESVNVTMLKVSREVASHSSDPVKYCIIYTFDVPLDIDIETTSVRVEFIVPSNDWTVVGQFVPRNINIVKGERHVLVTVEPFFKCTR